MPANSFATSAIGSQVKSLASRCSFGRQPKRGERDDDERAVAREILQRERACRKRRYSMPGFQVAESRMAPMMQAISGRLIEAVQPSGSAAVGRRRCVAPRRTRHRGRRKRRAPRRRRASGLLATGGRSVQKKSTPRRKPTNSGGSPSGDSAPPILATRKMKKTTTCTLFARAALARISGRTKIMAAPVVPTMLAIAVPNARMPVLTSGPAAQGAGDQDAAGHDVKREQQHDEAHIFGEHGVHESGERGRRRRSAAASGNECRQRPERGDLAVMRVPEFREQQRAGGDAQQDAGERQRPGPAHRRAVEVRGVSGCGHENRGDGEA